MTPETAKFYAPYFQALAKGVWCKWSGIPAFSIKPVLRILEAPQVIYCNKLVGLHIGSDDVHLTETDAINAASSCTDDYEYIAKRFVSEE